MPPERATGPFAVLACPAGSANGVEGGEENRRRPPLPARRRAGVEWRPARVQYRVGARLGERSGDRRVAPWRGARERR